MGPGDDDDALVGEINVTPLVDVVLVLLVIFMVTAPLLTRSVDVDLPEVTTDAPAPVETLVVSIGPEGTLHIGENIVTLDEVRRRVQERGKTGTVYLRGDKAAQYGHVMSVLDAMRGAGESAVSLVVQPLPDDASATGDGRSGRSRR